jgi:O-antigen/teichoic acid export membrane protein
MKPWAKIGKLSRLASEYAGAQAVIQFLGIASGLLIVNFLPVREYALYALALSVLTFLSVFSDLGLSGALLFFRRETRKTHAAFFPYINATLRIRRGLLLAGAAVAVTFVFVIGSGRGFDSSHLAAVSVATVVVVWFQVSASIGLLMLRLEAMYRESYLAEGLGNAVRLLGVGAMVASSALFAWVAMLPGLAGAIATNAVARRSLNMAGEHSGVNSHAAASPPYRDLMRYILPTSVSTAYYSIQAPLVIWLSAVFSGTETIAEVGALGRLGAVMGLVTGFMGTVLFPRLAAVTDDALYLRRFLQFWVVLIAFSVVVVGCAIAVPKWFLWLLGSSYSDLSEGFVIVTITSVLGTWGGYVVSVNNARGWVRPQPVLVAVYAAIQIALIAILDLGSTIGVLGFGLLSSVAGLVLHSGVSAVGFLRPELVRVPTDLKRLPGD